VDAAAQQNSVASKPSDSHAGLHMCTTVAGGGLIVYHQDITKTARMLVFRTRNNFSSSA
jgi:hypothetical protein